MITYILAVLAFFVIFLKYWYFSNFRQKIKKIPGPPKLPFIGNTLDLARHRDDILSLFQTTWVQEYGDIFVSQNFQHYSVLVSSPEYIEEVLKSPTLITKGVHYKLLKSWLGDGILLSTGDKWRIRRRLMTPAFHFQILESFFDVFNEQSQILAQQIEKSLSPDQEADIFPLINKCALDIICETAMGVSINAQTHNSEYSQAVHEMSRLFNERAQKPWFFYDFIFHQSKTGRDHLKNLKIVQNFTRQVIEERRLKLELRKDSGEDTEPQKQKKAFLDLLLETSDKSSSLSDEDIQEEVDTIMFAGHDTNSATIVWFLYLMAKHPQEQEKVYKELVQVFGSSHRYCTNKEIPLLKYLECCIKETLRILPSVPGINRTATEELRLGDYTVPVGCNIGILIQAVHRSPKYFPDPDSFIPERFFPENSKGRHSFAFIPFSAGPRNCLGQKFALLEEKVILATLVRRFRFELSPKTECEPRLAITLKPKDKLILRIIKR